MNIRHSALLAAVLASLSFAPARAEDAPAAQDPTKPEVQTASPEEIQQWIKDLDSNIFTARQTAAKKLFETGKEAVEPLVKAATGDSLEVTRQAIDLLRRLHDSNDAAVKEAAQAGLKKIAESDNKSAAARASEAITQANNAKTPLQPQPLPVAVGGIRIIGGANPIQQIKAQNINGNKTIDVTENGKHIKIEEDNTRIKVTITEKVNGQDKTETTEGKNIDELKKKNAEAGKIYDKYAGNVGGNIILGGANGAIQIQIQAQAAPMNPAIPVLPVPNGPPNPNPLPNIPAVPVPPNAVPIQAVPLQIGNIKISSPDEAKKTKEQIDQARKNLDQALEQLKKLNEPKGEAANKLRESIEAAQQSLEEAKKSLNE